MNEKSNKVDSRPVSTKRDHKLMDLDAFNKQYPKASDQIHIIMEKPERFIEVEGVLYYIPDSAKLVIESAAKVQLILR